MYWGKYVQHDNNRDGMGQYLKLTQNITKGVLEWHPTVLHDLHEAQSYLYVSTGTGPITSRSTRSPSMNGGCWPKPKSWRWPSAACPACSLTAFYDGWVPNYLFWIALTHNSFGRFYEVQSYGPDINENLRCSRPRPAANGTGRIRRCPDQVGTAQQYQHPGIDAADRAE